MPISHSNPRSAAALLLACALTTAALAQPFQYTPLKPGEAKEPKLESKEPVPPVLQGKQNAALAYHQLRDAVTKEQGAALGNGWTSRDEGPLTEEHRKLLAEHRDYVQGILRATEIEDCDWGIQYQDGFGALLPHLGQLRGFCRVLLFDSRRCLADNDKRGYVERVNGVYRLSRHASQGPVLISSLVGEAIQATAVAETRQQLDAGRLDVETARGLLNAARGNVGDDTHHYKDAIRMEAYLAVDWVKSRYTGADAGKRLLAELSFMDDGRETETHDVAGMDGEALAREAEKARAYYEEVQRIWDDPDAARKFEEVQKRLEEGKYGTFTFLIASFERCHRSMVKGKSELAVLVKDLEGFVRGEYVPASQRTPAEGGAVEGRPAQESKGSEPKVIQPQQTQPKPADK